MMNISRRAVLGLAAGSVYSLAVPGVAGAQHSKVFRFAPHAALRIVDPISTPAYHVRDHGFLVYDQLFALDENFVPRPQMVDIWETSDDQLTYTFHLRDGLRFHDGQPVAAEDCIASIARWAKRDVLGTRMAAVTESMTAEDERTFRIRFSEPFGVVLDALSKSSYLPLFVMPKRIAETPPETPIQEAVGSGPFRFVADEFEPGVRWVYERNPDYVSRDEPSSGMAGGKIVKIDRIESVYFPNKQTALNALQRGEIDGVESFSADQLSLVEDDSNIVTARALVPIAPSIRLNWAQPPFNDVMTRRALQAAVTQRDYLEAWAGDAKHYELCGAFFGCGTPLESSVGIVDHGEPDLEKARALLAQSSYNGEKVVIFNPTDIESFQPGIAMTSQVLQQLGMNVEIQAMDWATFLQRRNTSAPVSEGGWSIIQQGIAQIDLNSPLTNPNFDARGTEGHPGFVDDPEIERLKMEFQRAGDEATRKSIAEQIQLRGHEQVVCILLGYYFDYRAIRTGIDWIQTPMPVGWGLDVEA